MSEDGYFDERVARRYDASKGPEFEEASIRATVDFLAALAGGGRALELAIGTGRIAVPLRERGVPVHGIDMSKAMVKRLRAKPGAKDIGVTIGDFSTTRVEGQFSLAYLVFNTIMNVTTQAAQVATFRNAAAHLEPGGRFVIEVGMPDLQRLPVGGRFVPFIVEDEHLGFDEYDIANQGLISHHYEFVKGRDGAARRPVPLRLAGRARPHGRDGGHAPRRALGRLAARAVHEREPAARVGLGEGDRLTSAGFAAHLRDAYRVCTHRGCFAWRASRVGSVRDPGAAR